MPVLPDVASTITERPGTRRPSRSAASIIASAGRSLTDPPGFICSHFADDGRPPRRPSAAAAPAACGRCDPGCCCRSRPSFSLSLSLSFAVGIGSDEVHRRRQGGALDAGGLGARHEILQRRVLEHVDQPRRERRSRPPRARPRRCRSRARRTRTSLPADRAPRTAPPPAKSAPAGAPARSRRADRGAPRRSPPCAGPAGSARGNATAPSGAPRSPSRPLPVRGGGTPRS